MAISKISDRGTHAALDAALTSTLTITNPTLIAVGNYLILRVAADNSGTNGAARTLTIPNSASGDVRNAWTIKTPANSDPGAASAGVTVWVCYAKVVTAYQAGDVIILNWSGNIGANAEVLEEWYGIHATTPEVATPTPQIQVAGTTLGTAVTGTPSAAGQLFYVSFGWQGVAADTFVQDTDTTNGSWVTPTSTASADATRTNNVRIVGGYKIVTASGAQSYNPTGITSGALAAAALIFDAAPPVARTMAVGTGVANNLSTASGAKATTVIRTRRVTAKAATSSSAKATPTVSYPTAGFLISRRAVAKVGSSSSTKASLRGTRPVAGKAATSSSAKASLSTSVPGISRTMAGKAATSTSAKATPAVSYLGPGFKVSRRVSGRAPAAVVLRGDTQLLGEGFGIQRRVGAKAGSASSAKAQTTVSYYTGGGFFIARAIAAKAASAASTKASVDRTQVFFTTELSSTAWSKSTTIRRAATLNAKVSTASSAKAQSFDTGSETSLTGKAPTAASAKATVRRAATFAAKLPTVSNVRALLRDQRAEVAAHVSTASGAKATLVRVRGVAAKAATLSSAKASVRRLRSIAAKAPTASSLKAALAGTGGFAAKLATASSTKAVFVRARRVITKLSSSSSAKATQVARLRLIFSKSSTSTAAKATTVRRVRGLVVKTATSASTKANLRGSRPLAAKAAAAISAKGSLTTEHHGEAVLGAYVPNAASAKATILEARPLLTKLATSSKLIARVGANRQSVAKAPSSSSAKSALSRVRLVSTRLATSVSSKATVVRAVRHQTKIATATSAKAAFSVQRGVAAKSATSNNAKATVSRLHPIPLSVKLSTSSKAVGGQFNRGGSFVSRAPTSTTARAVLLITRVQHLDIQVGNVEAKWHVTLDEPEFMLELPTPKWHVGPPRVEA